MPKMELYNYNKKIDENYNLEEIHSESLNKSGARKFVLIYDSPYKTGIKENNGFTPNCFYPRISYLKTLTLVRLSSWFMDLIPMLTD